MLEHIARRNGKTITLTLDQLQAYSGPGGLKAKSTKEIVKGAFTSFSLYVSSRALPRVSAPTHHLLDLDPTSNRSSLGRGSLLTAPSRFCCGVRLSSRIYGSIAVVLIHGFMTGLIGLAYPLFNSFLPLYLKERVSSTAGTSETYRNYTIISVLGIPGSLVACAVVDWTRGEGKWAVGGRKLTMAVSTLLTGVFLFLFTTSKSEAAVLGFSCASGLTQ